MSPQPVQHNPSYSYKVIFAARRLNVILSDILRESISTWKTEVVIAGGNHKKIVFAEEFIFLHYVEYQCIILVNEVKFLLGLLFL